MKKLLAIVVGTILLSGCSTIVGDKTQLVQVNSEPSGAEFKIQDESGRLVAQGTTPQGVTLDKSDGSYFGGKSYHITFNRDGYIPTTLPVTSSVNGWYIGGNLVFGGLIGYLIVDPFNGGMYTLKPKEANGIMQKTSTDK